MPSYGSPGRRVAIVAGVRTPFARVGDRAQGLQRDRAREALRRRADPAHRARRQARRGDRLRHGRSVRGRAEHRARSVAPADAAEGLQAFTVSRACASANQAITDAADQIALGHADVVIAGGAESLSNVPILHSRGMSDALVAASRAKTLGGRVQGARRACVRAISCRSRRRSPSRRPARRWASRPRRWRRSTTSRASEQDQFALRSHRLASAGTQDGRLTAEIVPLVRAAEIRHGDDERQRHSRRHDASNSSRALKPVFDRQVRHGDRRQLVAAHRRRRAVLLMSEDRARSARLHAARLTSAVVRVRRARSRRAAAAWVPCSPRPVALQRAGLSLRDMDLVEMHEAFAAQVLSQPAGASSRRSGPSARASAEPVGEVDRARLNVMGGSIAIGHPFGATGARIITTLLQRARTPRWTVRAHDRLRGRRNGLRDGRGATQ